MSSPKDSNRLTTAIHVWLVLWKAASSVEKQAQRSVRELGLGLSDFAVLEILLHKGAQTVNIIGKKVLLTSGSITTAIDRLAARGLVKRTLHPADQRARLVELTPRGKALIDCAFRKHAEDMERVVAVLSHSERTELIRLLKKLGLHAAGIPTITGVDSKQVSHRNSAS